MPRRAPPSSRPRTCTRAATSIPRSASRSRATTPARLTPDRSGGDDLRVRMLREARAAARLTHPHIAGVYDVLEHDGHAIIVMEYVEGESLRARLARGRLSIDELVAIGRQLASAL